MEAENQTSVRTWTSAAWGVKTRQSPPSHQHYCKAVGKESEKEKKPWIDLLDLKWHFPNDSGGKESACNARDLGSTPGSGRCPGDGNGNPLQYSCLGDHMDRGAWQTTVHEVAESNTTEWLSMSRGSEMTEKTLAAFITIYSNRLSFFFSFNNYLALLGLSCSIRTLDCGMWDLVPWPEIKLGSLHWKHSLSHWITREVSNWLGFTYH